MDNLTNGQVLEVQTTDKGAKSDLTAWGKSTGHVLIDLKKKTIHLSFIFKKDNFFKIKYTPQGNLEV